MKEFTKYTVAAGTEEEKDILVACLCDFGIDAFEEKENELIASGEKNVVDEPGLDAYLQNNDFKFRKEYVEDRNWNAIWESSFEPVLVDEFAAIRAGFHQPIAGVMHEIVITPKMSFGTGHHATTWLMMRMMREIDFNGRHVFDFGTGTGVLAILAEKLGAKQVLAIDNDEWSILNARENIGHNNCTRIDVQLLDQPPEDLTAGIVLANINKHILLRNMAGIARCVNSNGWVLLSGLLDTDEPDIVHAAAAHSLEFEKKQAKNGWIALLFIKAGS